MNDTVSYSDLRRLQDDLAHAEREQRARIKGDYQDHFEARREIWMEVRALGERLDATEARLGQIEYELARVLATLREGEAS